MHGLYDGGAGAGLDDYWRMMMRTANISAAVSSGRLLDEGVKRPDTGEIDVAGNQAPDGIVGPYRQREGELLHDQRNLVADPNYARNEDLP